jgi:hypothetical protein
MRQEFIPIRVCIFNGFTHSYSKIHFYEIQYEYTITFKHSFSIYAWLILNVEIQMSRSFTHMAAMCSMNKICYYRGVP